MTTASTSAEPLTARFADYLGLFLVAMATLMLEAGADIRQIQVLLGHANVETTSLYTHVGIAQLQAVHRATHPASGNRRHRDRHLDEEHDDE